MKLNFFNVIFLLISIFLLIISITVIVYPPLVWFDPSAGFQTMFSWIHGASFNHTKEYDFSCIISPKASYQFNSIWSPGQYIFPLIFYKIGFSLGVSISLVTILFTILGLFGYYFLFVCFNFTKEISISSCLIILTSRFLLFNFGNYNGGDLLIFGGFPWIILITYKASSLNWYFFILVNICLLLLGAFLKLSFIITHLAILSWIIVMSYSKEGYSLKKNTVYIGIWVGISFLFFYFLLNYFYLSLGWNATQDAKLKLSTFGVISTWFFTLQASIFGAFSIGDLLNRIFLFPGNKILNDLTELGFLFFILSSIGLAAIYINRKKITNNYILLLLTNIVLHAIIYSYLYTKGAALELFSERYFRLSAILFVPFFIVIIFNLKLKYLKFSLIILLLLSSLYGLSSYFIKVKANYNSEKSIHGYSLAGYSKDLVKIIHKCDTIQQKDKVIGIGVLSLTNEFKSSTPLYLMTDIRDEKWLENKNYQCFSNNIYLFFKDSEKAKNNAILSSFKDYNTEDWRFYQIDKEWRLYYTSENNINLILD